MPVFAFGNVGKSLPAEQYITGMFFLLRGEAADILYAYDGTVAGGKAGTVNSSVSTGWGHGADYLSPS